MDSIDAVRVQFNPQQLIILNICLAFLMFGVALDIKLKDFKQIWTHPKPIIVGLLCQFLLFPTLTLGLIYLFRPPVSVAMGIVLVSCCPSGNMANFATHLAKANVALSVTLNSIITLAAAFATPLGYAFWSKFVPNYQQFSQEIYIQPLDMVKIIVQLILIPLSLGVFLVHYYPNFVDKIRKIVRWLSLAVFISFIIGALVANFDNVLLHLSKVFWLVLAHNTLALVMGYYISKLLKLKENDARTISIESGIHNTGLGLILIFNFFNGIGGMAMIAAWWGIWDLIAVFFLATWWSKHIVADILPNKKVLEINVIAKRDK